MQRTSCPWVMPCGRKPRGKPPHHQGDLCSWTDPCSPPNNCSAVYCTSRPPPDIWPGTPVHIPTGFCISYLHFVPYNVPEATILEAIPGTWWSLPEMPDGCNCPAQCRGGHRSNTPKACGYSPSAAVHLYWCKPRRCRACPALTALSHHDGPEHLKFYF